MTWDLGNSQEVFQRATAKCSIKLDTRVRQVQFSKESGLWKQQVVDDHGEVETFDRVVLACPASAAANIIRPMNWMEQNLIRAVEYHDEVHHSDWKDWLDVPVHQDTSCLPAQHHSSLLEHAAFLIDVDARGREGGGVNVEYTHNLSAFSPSARSLGVAPADCPMFMFPRQLSCFLALPSSENPMSTQDTDNQSIERHTKLFSSTWTSLLINSQHDHYPDAALGARTSGNLLLFQLDLPGQWP